MNSLIKKLSLLAGVAGLTLATQLNALTIAQSFGAIDQATPSNSTAEVAFINALLAISPVGENAPSFPATFDDGGGNLDRFNTVVPIVTATTVGGIQGAGPSASVNVTGWTYLYGKFGNGAFVWYVGNLSGAQDLPLNLGQAGGQSHYSLYNPTSTPGTSVPDGGATILLLGGAMTGVAFLARRIRR